MKKLTARKTFDTGLKLRGKPVTVGLEPGVGGGKLLFKSGVKSARISFRQILANVLEPKPAGVTDEDLVDLGSLENRIGIMVLNAETDEEEKALCAAKCKVMNLVRDMRDERRLEAGLRAVTWHRTK